jgi:CheY-like chemotaxis protein
MAQKILIVDDDSVTRKNLSELLRGFGHDVFAVKSGEHAIKSLEEEDYDLALVDLKMPKMNGIEVLKAIKAIKPSLYVVIITAYASIETAIEAMKLGAFDYIRKPFKSKDLKVIINNIIEEKRFEKSLIEQKSIKPEKDVFASFLRQSKGKKAMGLSIEKPKDILEKFAFRDIPLYWITTKGKGKKCIRPDEMNKIYKLINSFIKRNREAVVLIHGFEILIKNNSKKDLNNFLEKLNENINKNNSTLIISANPDYIDKEDLFELEDVLSGNYTQQMSEALANPIRRDVLRYLAQVERAGFTQILKNIPENDSAKFSFHIKKLSSYDVINKDDKGTYSLTKRGINLISILKNIEGERIRESSSQLVVSSS